MKVLDRDNEQKNAATDAWSKNWLVPVVLLMLRKWSSYGYELMEKMATFGLAAMNPGTFYRTLRQMEKDGMIRSNWNISERGPALHMYSITEAGDDYLKLWKESLNQYQQLLDTFFRLYTGLPTRADTPTDKKDD